MDDVYGEDPAGKGNDKGSGPIGWIKNKLGNMREANPALFSFATGCVVGGIVLLVRGTNLNLCLPGSSCSKSKGGAKKRSNGPKIKVTVQEDQTLGDILVKYVGDYTEANVSQIVKDNKLKNANLILPGQVLLVTDNRQIEAKVATPRSTATQAPAAAPAKVTKPAKEEKKPKQAKKKARKTAQRKRQAPAKVANKKKSEAEASKKRAQEESKKAKEVAKPKKEEPKKEVKSKDNGKKQGGQNKKAEGKKGFLFFGKKN